MGVFCDRRLKVCSLVLMNDILFCQFVKYGTEFWQHLVSLSLIGDLAHLLEGITHGTGEVLVVFLPCLSLSCGFQSRLVISHNFSLMYIL